jgi:cytochrome b6-f complex iron-sulfur subunit
MGMNRRDFLGFVGVGGLASSVPVVLAACTPTPPASNPPQASAPPAPPRSDGFQAVGTVSDLGQGALLVKDFPGGSVLVARDAANPNQVYAVSPTCTHQGCVVEWKGDQSVFVCPCHGAKFKPTGEVLAAPATRPLKALTAKIEGDAVLVKA